jgi:hypothetical protein
MAVRRWRIALATLGLGLVGVGLVVLMQEVTPTHYLGILSWFIGALIIHDGIIAPVVFFVTVVMRRRLERVPGGIVALIAVPEIIKKSIGTLSSSILPQNYALHLGLFVVALVVLTLGAIAAYRLIFARRQKLLSSADQA